MATYRIKRIDMFSDGKRVWYEIERKVLWFFWFPVKTRERTIGNMDYGPNRFQSEREAENFISMLKSRKEKKKMVTYHNIK